MIQVSEGVPAKRTELYFQDLTAKTPIRTLLKEDAEFDFEDAGDWLFLSTNWKAPKRRVIRVDLKNPAQDHWKEVVPESTLAIEGVSAAGGRLFVTLPGQRGESREAVRCRREAAWRSETARDRFGIQSRSATGRTMRCSTHSLHSSNLPRSYRFAVSSGKQESGSGPRFPCAAKTWRRNRSGTSRRTEPGCPCFWSCARVFRPTATCPCC